MVSTHTYKLTRTAVSTLSLKIKHLFCSSVAGTEYRHLCWFFYNQQQSNLRVYLWATTLWNTAVSPLDTPNFTSGMYTPCVGYLLSLCRGGRPLVMTLFVITTGAEFEQPGAPFYRWVGCRDHAVIASFPHSERWQAQGGTAYICRGQRKHVFHNMGPLIAEFGCKSTHKSKTKYSHKRQSAVANPFRPKPVTLTLIPRSEWHLPPCSSKIYITHSHDKPQISPNWFFSYMLMAFIAPPIGWAQHALAGLFPASLSTYPPSFVMIGQRMWKLWPIISKPRPLQKYISSWRPCFLTNLALIYVRNTSFYPPQPYTKFGVDGVNLSKVLLILLFFTLCKLAKNLGRRSFMVQEAFL